MNRLQRFCREAVAWKHLRHPNVLPLLGVTVSERRFAMVSKWMEHGNINEFVEKENYVNRAELVCHSSTLAHTKAWLMFCSVG
jgi:serine/threonine protein kinase